MTESLHFDDLVPYAGMLLRGIGLTLQLTLLSIVIGMAVGIACAAARGSRSPVLRFLAGSYIEVVRNTPFLVQLFFLFFGLASIGLKLSETQAAVLAMTVNLGAYAGEIIRSGIDSIPRGQIEAGQSLALTPAQIFRHIILPPALAKTYPALTSQFIIVLLGSSVVSQISAEELTFAANFIQSRNFRSLEVCLVVTGLYLGLSLGLRQLFRLIGSYAFATR